RGRRVNDARLRTGEGFVIGRHHLVLRDVKGALSPAAQEEISKYKELPRSEPPKKSSLLTERELLQVSLHWGDQVLQQRTFVVGEEITVGSQQKATFGVTLTDDKLLKKPFPIAKYRKGILLLHIPVEATGLVWVGNDAFSVDSLRHKDKTSSD